MADLFKAQAKGDSRDRLTFSQRAHLGSPTTSLPALVDWRVEDHAREQIDSCRPHDLVMGFLDLANGRFHFVFEAHGRSPHATP